jgi:hypothetical protein
MAARTLLTPPTKPSRGSTPTPSCPQVLALQSLRRFDLGGGDLPDVARGYNPSNPEVIDLLSRWVMQRRRGGGGAGRG